MIYELRRRHRRVWLVLMVVLPVAYALALWSKPEAPTTDRLPRVLLDGVSTGSAPLDLARTVRIEGDPWGELRIGGHSVHSSAAPDLLLYWSSGAPSSGPSARTSLPANALFVGSLGSAREFLLPPSASDQGTLLLYSGTKQTVVAAVPWLAPLSSEGADGSAEGPP